MELIGPKSPASNTGAGFFIELRKSIICKRLLKHRLAFLKVSPTVCRRGYTERHKFVLYRDTGDVRHSS